MKKNEDALNVLRKKVLGSNYKQKNSRVNEANIMNLSEQVRKEMGVPSAKTTTLTTTSISPKTQTAKKNDNSAMEQPFKTLDDLHLPPDYEEKLFKDKNGLRRTLTTEEIEEVERFALRFLKAVPTGQAKVREWLKGKLGGQFREQWKQKAGLLLAKEKKALELEAKRPKEGSVFKIAHSAQSSSAPRGDEGYSNFAVVALAGSQYKVTLGDLLVVSHLADAEVGKEYVIKDVLMVANHAETFLGRPMLPEASVLATVEEQTKEEKVLKLYKKKGTHSQKMRGFRREVTVLRIQAINFVM